MQLSSELKRLYPRFTFEIIPIVLGATRLVSPSLRKNIEKIGVKNIKYTMLKCHGMTLLGENSKISIKNEKYLKNTVYMICNNILRS